MPADQLFSIGAAAREVGVSTHVLRKWESRNNLISPQRGENGRRTYSAEQIQLLRLVKQLTSSGISLAQLEGRNIEQLRELQQGVSRTATGKVTVVGTPFFAEAGNTANDSSFQTITTLNDWLSDPDPAGDTTILDVPNLDQGLLNRIENHGNSRVIIVYRYAQPSVLRRARASDIQAYRGPISQSLIEDLLGIEPAQSTDSLALELPPAPTRRIDLDEVRRFSALSSSVACECPAHVADLLSDLNAFENYSLECVSEQPKDSEMHAYLHQVAANARSLFETALERLAEHENISLNTVK